jgi:hypothetical protein
LKGIPLPLDRNPTSSTLKSISGIIEPNESDNIPDLQSLGCILYFSSGITKTILNVRKTKRIEGYEPIKP